VRLAELMLEYRSRIDWQTFWIREIIILFVPWPIAVLALPKSSYIGPVGVSVLLAILIGLTLWNLIWALFRSSASNRARI
jgi:hypothetical protein